MLKKQLIQRKIAEKRGVERVEKRQKEAVDQDSQASDTGEMMDLSNSIGSNLTMSDGYPINKDT